MATRLWVVSELYYPEETSTGYFLTRIAEGLGKQFPTKVLCAQPTYSSRGARAPRREIRNGVEIRRCWSTTFDPKVLISRILNLTTLTLSFFSCELLDLRKGDLVLVLTNPPSLPFVTLAACRFRHARCVLLVHDVYPNILYATGTVQPGSLLSRLFEEMNRRLYAGMERIIVLGRDMRDLVMEKLKDGKQRLALIPNWADVEEIRPHSTHSNRLLEQIGLVGKFVVQYSGNIGRTHGVDDLIKAAQQMRDHADIHFLFIGSGAKRKILEKAVRENGFANVTLLPLRPRHELNTSLNACHVAVVSLVPGMKGASVPSRMYNILAAGKPIVAVAEEGSELALLVREEHVGWVVPPHQPEEIVRAILDARSDPDRLTAMGRRARSVAESRYTIDRAIDAYTSLLRQLWT